MDKRVLVLGSYLCIQLVWLAWLGHCVCALHFYCWWDMVCVYSGKGTIFFKGRRHLALGCSVVGASSKIVKKKYLVTVHWSRSFPDVATEGESCQPSVLMLAFITTAAPSVIPLLRGLRPSLRPHNTYTESADFPRTIIPALGVTPRGFVRNPE